MNYKVEGAIRKNKKTFIIGAILWLLIAIVFVAPFSYGLLAGKINGAFSLDTFINEFTSTIVNPFKALGGILSISGGFITFIKHLLGFTVVYSVFVFIGLVRTAPKHEYSDIEHGSSGWSKRGEQYTVLSKNKGIVLAEDNYLPLDKHGNVNVLVVGRIWCW